MPVLAITANGAFGEHPFVADRSRRPFTDIKEIDAAGKLGGYGEPDELTIYNLYQQYGSGEIKLSGVAQKALKRFIKYRNNDLPPFEMSGGVRGRSKGCPAVQDVVYMRADDLTAQQWNDLTGGGKPIAGYEPNTQKLTFNRSVIHDTNQLFADVLQGS